MMLNGWSGRIDTSSGFAPSGPIHCEKGTPAPAVVEGDPLRRRVAFGSVESRRDVPVEQEDFRAAVPEHHHQARRRRGGRQRRDRRARGEDSAESGGMVDRGPGADGDGVAAAHAVALQREGDAVHQRGQFGVIQFGVTLDERCMAWPLRRMGADQLRQRPEFLREQPLGRHWSPSQSRIPIGPAKGIVRLTPILPIFARLDNQASLSTRFEKSERRRPCRRRRSESDGATPSPPGVDRRDPGGSIPWFPPGQFPLRTDHKAIITRR